MTRKLPPPQCPICCRDATRAGKRGRMRCMSCGHLFTPGGRPAQRLESAGDRPAAPRGPTVAAMAEHVAALCAEHEIEVGPHSRGGRACRRERWINIRPVKSEVTYAVALHELGHVLGREQSKPRLFKEAAAWTWARDNAIAWTPRMVETMASALRSYADWAKRKHDTFTSNAPRWPEREHAFWSLSGLDYEDFAR